MGIIGCVKTTTNTQNSTTTETTTTETTTEEIATYLVTFETGDGSPVEPMEVEEGLLLVAPSTTLLRHIVTGWYTDEEYTNKWNFNTDIVNNDITLYVKWEQSEIVINLEASNINLTGAQYGGDIYFPESNENLGASTIIQKETSQTLNYRALSINPTTTVLGGITITNTLEKSNPLYLYFNWDGSFGWIEDYTGTVDTSRESNGQFRQSYNLKDYYDLDLYRVYVNYIRYRIITVDGEYLYYDGDAIVDSKDGSTFVLKNQYSQLDDNGTPKDPLDDSFDIAIERTNIDDTLASYIENDNTATVEIFGIQLIAVYEDKLMEYWETDTEAVANGNIDMYTYYEAVTGYTILTYMPLFATKDENVPQQTLYNYKPANLADPVPADYLAMIRTYFTIEGEDQTGDVIELTQQKIEYAGGSEIPKIGVTLDENTGDIYYSTPVLANTTAMYEGEFYETFYQNFQFFIYVGFNNNGEYIPNPARVATLEPTFGIQHWVDENKTIRQFTQFSYLENDPILTAESYGFPYWDQSYISAVNNSYPMFKEKTDLIAIYSVQYNKPIVNILTGETVKYPGTDEDIIVNMNHSMNWIYQGNFPIQLPEGVTKDEVFIQETYNYVYKSYKINITDSGFNTDIGYNDYLIGNGIASLSNIQDEPVEARRFGMDGFLGYYFNFSPSVAGRRRMYPYTVLISNTKRITFNNNEIIEPSQPTIHTDAQELFGGFYDYSTSNIIPGPGIQYSDYGDLGTQTVMLRSFWAHIFRLQIIIDWGLPIDLGEVPIYLYHISLLENARNGNNQDLLDFMGITKNT